METKEGEKPIKRKYRGMTRKHMIIKNRSKGVKLSVKYNLDGIFIGESAVHLTSYLGVLARTMVPIRYKTWHVVPKQLKDKLWDSIEQKQLLLPEAVDKPIRKVEDVTPPEAIEPQKKENIVAGGTIILECGPNYLVVVDAPYDSSAPLPIPIPGQTTTVGAAIGYQVLWPTDLVIIRTPILASKKAKKQKVNEVEVKSKGEKPQDMKNFETLVGLILSTSRAYPINFPDDVFGESFKTFMMKEDMEMIISSKKHLHRKLIDAKQANDMFLSIHWSQRWNREGSKENSFHWVLVALEMKKMIAYYLDPMARQPCDDLKDIVNMAMRINPPEKQKTSKREPTWVKVVCPRQPGSVECGYYVMRYMKEIIANPNQLTSKLAMFSIWIILGLLYYD
ncbi:hypothetical protein AAG906_013546 [Vitis piasezkii]